MMKRLAEFYNQFWKPLSVRRRGTLIIAIPVSSLFVSLTIFAWFKSTLIEDENWVRRTQQIRLETKQLRTALLDAETNMRGYGLTGRQEFLVAYETAVGTIPDTLNKLERLVGDNSQQQAQLAEIQQMMDRSLNLMNQKILFQQTLEDSNDSQLVVSTALLYDWLEQGKTTMQTTRLQIEQLLVTAERLLTESRQHRNFYRQFSWLLFTLSAVVGICSGFLAIYLFRQLARELAANQQQLHQKNQQLEQACDRLQRFTANASHELRTPLAAILSNAQVGLITHANDPQFLCQRLSKIVEQTKSMSTLVKELLFLARCEDKLPQEKFQPTNLDELLETLKEEWREIAEARQLQLQIQLPQSSLVVMADPNLLRQAVSNLLSNACRYTPAGGTVQLRLLDWGKRAAIEVEDNGVGISEADLPHIFERFYRVHSAQSNVKGGSGLGLAIAEQIVQAHQGTISVSSVFGRGTTFQIALPCKK